MGAAAPGPTIEGAPPGTPPCLACFIEVLFLYPLHIDIYFFSRRAPHRAPALGPAEPKTGPASGLL